MALTLADAVSAVIISSIVLVLFLCYAFKSSKKLHPVRCVHCWTHLNRDTVIGYSETEGQWGIGPECIQFYWQFSMAPKSHR